MNEHSIRAVKQVARESVISPVERTGLNMNNDPFTDPENTHEEILAATYNSLEKYGYADLTIKKIGEEFSKSPSLIYHHFEDKDDLVLSLLEHLLDRFAASMVPDLDQPKETVETVIEWAVDPEPSPEKQSSFATLFELRANAIHDPAYQDHFVRSDAVFREYLSGVVAHGIESGDFKECDPDAVADMVMIYTFGGIFGQVLDTDQSTWLENVRTEVNWYLEHRLFK